MYVECVLLIDILITDCHTHIFFSLPSPFCSTGDWIEYLACASQVYHWNRHSHLFIFLILLFFLFFETVTLSRPGCSLIWSSLVSTFLIVGKTGSGHQDRVLSFLLKFSYLKIVGSFLSCLYKMSVFSLDYFPRCWSQILLSFIPSAPCIPVLKARYLH